MRAKDHAYEALAAVTGTDMQQGRGELNAALRSIKQQTSLTGQLLAGEIQVRARQYRRLMPEVVLTPNALAKHWVRVAQEAERATGTNLHGGATGCGACHGDKFVPVGTNHVLHADGHNIPYEQYAPCPSCNPVEVSWWRFDGTQARTPDAARTRELMRR